MTTVLCWDIDGTLLTTGRAGVFAFEQAIRDVCGVEPDLMEVETSGFTDHEVARRFLEHSGCGATDEIVEAVLRAYERYLPERLHWRQGQVMPGVREALDALSQREDVLNLLLTGNTAAGGEAKLRHYGLWEYFAGGAFCMNGNPRASIAGQVRALAEQQLGSAAEPNAIYVIGDTPADILCGKTIGARTIAVASGSYSADELNEHEPWATMERLPPPHQLERVLGLAV
jgi:phosphoglycolate phosphatase-like HAD superfamily hydrolase